MIDSLSTEQRSIRMASIKGQNTGPEQLVASILKAARLRFQSHHADLPGKPDFVFPRRKAAIFVHGCFWHRHDAKSCKLARLPKSRLDFWLPKLEGNRLRDHRVQGKLRKQGWRVMVVWECRTRNKEQLKNRLLRFLG